MERATALGIKRTHFQVIHSQPHHLKKLKVNTVYHRFFRSRYCNPFDLEYPMRNILMTYFDFSLMMRQNYVPFKHFVKMFRYNISLGLGR